MANHPSAEKRHRQASKRQVQNRWWKSRVRTATRAVTEAAEKKDKKKAAETLKVAMQEICKAETKGVMHANSASRKIARLSRLVEAL